MSGVQVHSSVIGQTVMVRVDVTCTMLSTSHAITLETTGRTAVRYVSDLIVAVDKGMTKK